MKYALFPTINCMCNNFYSLLCFLVISHWIFNFTDCLFPHFISLMVFAEAPIFLLNKYLGEVIGRRERKQLLLIIIVICEKSNLFLAFSYLHEVEQVKQVDLISRALFVNGQLWLNWIYSLALSLLWLRALSLIIYAHFQTSLLSAWAFSLSLRFSGPNQLAFYLLLLVLPPFLPTNH